VFKGRAVKSNRTIIGLLAGLAAALIGGAWQVVTRQSTTTTIAPADLAILRYGIPALVLMPVVWRVGLWPQQVPRRYLVAMLVGAGLPFGLLAMAGTRFAPAAHMGVLMAGASPLFATAFAWACWAERPDRWRLLGLACMALGVLVLGGKALFGVSPEYAWRGDLLFLAAAVLWAAFTVSFRRTGLSPWEGAALVNVWSAMFLVPLRLWSGPVLLLQAPLHDLLFQALWQGVLAGLVGLWVFAVAIARLGAARAAAFGALAPVASALGGWWWLGDALTLFDAVAVALAVLGVALVSGALRWPASGAGPPHSRIGS
jgi:drug/metabolite transporter (DMT)-like permease